MAKRPKNQSDLPVQSNANQTPSNEVTNTPATSNVQSTIGQTTQPAKHIARLPSATATFNSDIEASDNRNISFAPAGTGRGFALPSRELKALQRQGDFTNTPSPAGQVAQRQLADINQAFTDLGLGEQQEIENFIGATLNPQTPEGQGTDLLGALQSGDLSQLNGVQAMANATTGQKAGIAVAGLSLLAPWGKVIQIGKAIATKLGFFKGLVGGSLIGGGLVTAWLSRGKQMEADVRSLNRNAGQLVAQVQGGTLPAQYAISRIEEIEVEMRRQLGELHRALSTSPKDIAKRKNAENFMREQLTEVSGKRLALERYLVLQNPADLTNYISLDVEPLLE